jgi:hypothetical protein
MFHVTLRKIVFTAISVSVLLIAALYLVHGQGTVPLVGETVSMLLVSGGLLAIAFIMRR